MHISIDSLSIHIMSTKSQEQEKQAAIDRLIHIRMPRMGRAPPLRMTAKEPITEKTYECDNCKTIHPGVVVVPMGLSWRSGWVLLCHTCHKHLNISGESDSKLAEQWEKYQAF
jgi:hypothetical protein